MSEKQISKNENNSATDQGPQQPTKKPYVRPVLIVIGKVGKIFSNN